MTFLNVVNKMFEQLRYKRATRNYFHPTLKDGKPRLDVSQGDMLKILSGDIVNPNKFASVKNKDYSFMIVGTPICGPLNSWAGREWGIDTFANAQLYSDWYAKICCENDSYVVFPKQSLFFHFDPRSEYHRGENFNSARKLELTLFDKKPLIYPGVDLRVLISNLSAGEVLGYMRDFKRRFNPK